mmetsp:Transcript_86541/g.268949  ORF Transcript_86541/g.268949 Transcript_86541/m.268949 type:complete len:206 (-) Transcript_86541:1444-2061(-)
MRLSAGKFYNDLLLDIVPAPDALRVAHQRDGLAAHVLAGQGGLGAQAARAVQPRDGDDVHAVLAGSFRSSHLARLRAVPVRRVQQDLGSLEGQAAGHLRDPDLVPEHQGHSAKRGCAHHRRELGPRRGPGALRGAEVGLAVLGDHALGPQEVGRVEELAAVGLHEAATQVHRVLFGTREQQLQHRAAVLRGALRVLGRLAARKAE